MSSRRRTRSSACPWASARKNWSWPATWAKGRKWTPRSSGPVPQEELPASMAWTMDRCGRRTPLGRPVVPLVKIMRNGSSGPTASTSASQAASESGSASSPETWEAVRSSTPGGTAPGESGSVLTTATSPSATSSPAAGASFSHWAGPETKATRGFTRSAMARAGSPARLAKSAAGSARSAWAPSDTSCQAGELSASMSTRSPARRPARESEAAARRTPRSKAAKLTSRGGAFRADGSRTRRKGASGRRRAVPRSRAGRVRSGNRRSVSVGVVMAWARG